VLYAIHHMERLGLRAALATLAVLFRHDSFSVSGSRSSTLPGGAASAPDHRVHECWHRVWFAAACAGATGEYDAAGSGMAARTCPSETSEVPG
jgi:hypothetical protein